MNYRERQNNETAFTIGMFLLIIILGIFMLFNWTKGEIKKFSYEEDLKYEISAIITKTDVAEKKNGNPEYTVMAVDEDGNTYVERDIPEEEYAKAVIGKKVTVTVTEYHDLFEKRGIVHDFNL